MCQNGIYSQVISHKNKCDLIDHIVTKRKGGDLPYAKIGLDHVKKCMKYAVFIVETYLCFKYCYVTHTIIPLRKKNEKKCSFCAKKAKINIILMNLVR